MIEYDLKFFFSGNMGRAGEEEEQLAQKIECRLCSCHDAYVRDAIRWMGIASRPDTNITKMMLDSGAFTAWSKGKKVEVDELIGTYNDVLSLADLDKVTVYLISLDVIPGSPGVTAGPAEIEEAIRQSDINFNILVKEFGDRVIPVYHQNETEARLHEVASMADYICASPRNDLPEWTRVRWAEEVHSKLPPGKRTHGLATTGIQMTRRVPWWSVDSAAWLYSGAMGKIDCWDGKRWVSINISQESPSIKVRDQHYDTSPQYIKDIVDARAAYHGITIDQLRTDHMKRKLLNGLEIATWLSQFNRQPVPKQDGLFAL